MSLSKNLLKRDSQSTILPTASLIINQPAYESQERNDNVMVFRENSSIFNLENDKSFATIDSANEEGNIHSIHDLVIHSEHMTVYDTSKDHSEISHL